MLQNLRIRKRKSTIKKYQLKSLGKTECKRITK